MKPLPRAPHNSCVPRCSECCTGLTPISDGDLARLAEGLTRLGDRALLRQLRYWNRDPRRCPFVTASDRCFVYEARPGICRAFEHLQAAGCECPRAARGEASFDAWPVEEVAAFSISTFRPGPLGEEPSVTPTAWLGLALLEHLEGGRREEVARVPALSLSEFCEMKGEGGSIRWGAALASHRAPRARDLSRAEGS